MSDHGSSCSGGWNTDSLKSASYKRSCTDCSCLLIFIVFIICWLFIGYYAYWNGDLNRFYAPRDTYGRTCGVDDDVQKHPYLLFFDITECVSVSALLFGCSNTKQICVAKCPQETWFYHDAIKDENFVNWKRIQEKLICEDERIARTVNSFSSLQRVINDTRCAAYYVASTSALFPVCIPNPLNIKARSDNSFGIVTKTLETQNYFKNLAKVSNGLKTDFYRSWHLLILFTATAIVSCLFVILVMGVVTKLFVWTVLWFILFLLLYSSLVTYLRYNAIPPSMEQYVIRSARGHYSQSLDGHPSTIYEKLSWTFQQKKTWMYLFIVSAIMVVLYFLLVIFLRSRIEIAVMLIGEGSKAINSVKSTLCLPLVTRVLQLGLVVWFLLVLVYIKSLGNSVYIVRGLGNDTDCQCDEFKDNDWCVPEFFKEHCISRSEGGACSTAECTFFEFRSPKMQLYLQLYNIFGLLWSLLFVAGFNRMILSFCFATWYWTYNKNALPFFTLTYSVYTTTRYHLGTVAMGSFFIATCGFLRSVLERVHKMVRNSDGLVSQCGMWGMRCCFVMLEKFLVFISNNAYIMCTIVGSGFFGSATEAIDLLTRNVVRVVVLDQAMDFIMLIGKITVTFTLTTISYFSFSSNSLGLSYPWFPTILVGVITWLICSSFFGVYSVAVDTLFFSFLKDGELNDGSQNKPYYMSQKLKYILQEKTRG